MIPKKETKFASPLSPSLQAQGLLARLDKDHDGRLSREEAKGRQLLETFFDRIDANKDGSLDDEEFADALGMLDRMKP
jgi:Ca2+-binding EF-hand superfamily protein